MPPCQIKLKKRASLGLLSCVFVNYNLRLHALFAGNYVLSSCALGFVGKDRGECLDAYGLVDHRADVDLARVNEGECALLGVGVDEGCLEGDLLLEELKGLYVYRVVGTREAEEHYR